MMAPAVTAPQGGGNGNAKPQGAGKGEHKPGERRGHGHGGAGKPGGQRVVAKGSRPRKPRSAEEMDLAKAYAIRAQRRRKSASRPSA